MAKQQNLYKVFAEGEYWALENGQKSIRRYELDFIGNDDMKKAGFLSVFRNSLQAKSGEESAILKKMKEKYPNYKRFRTHIISLVVDLHTGKQVRELTLMNHAQILGFINKKGYPIDTELYPTASELRQALVDYRENPEAFLKFQEKRKASRGTEMKIYKALDNLNAQPHPAAPAPEVNSEADAFEDEDDIQDEFAIPELDDKDELDKLLDGV